LRRDFPPQAAGGCDDFESDARGGTVGRAGGGGSGTARLGNARRRRVPRAAGVRRATRIGDFRRSHDLCRGVQPCAGVPGEKGLAAAGRVLRWRGGIFPDEDSAGWCVVSEPTLFQGSTEPLAARMRPKTLDQFLGQEHLLGPGKALGELIRRGDVGSCIFWGPPGSGKTTLARLIANYTDRHFEPFSAVTEGVARVREIIKEAEERLKYEGRGTILFCDEIHRFNRAQQFTFLPWVENGIITLIGATTENPSFELTGALLSRCRVFVLEPLTDQHIRTVIERAVAAEQKGRERAEVRLGEEAFDLLVRHAQGDARRALNALEALFQHVANLSPLP